MNCLAAIYCASGHMNLILSATNHLLGHDLSEKDAATMKKLKATVLRVQNDLSIVAEIDYLQHVRAQVPKEPPTEPDAIVLALLMAVVDALDKPPAFLLDAIRAVAFMELPMALESPIGERHA